MDRKAIYAVIICAIIAGSNGIFIKTMSSMSAGSIAWFRTAIPVLILIPGVLKTEGLQPKGNYKLMLLASFINAARMYLFLVAYIYTSIGNAVVLFYSYPILVTAIESIFYKRKIKPRSYIFLGVAFLGIIITYAGKPFSFQSKDFVGMLAALSAALGYAITVIMFKSETGNYSRNRLIIYQNIIGALLFIPFLWTIPDAYIQHLFIAPVYAFVIGVVVFKLFFYGLNHLPATTASSLMYLEVVSAILLGYLLLGETLTWNTYVGGALILTSSYLVTRQNKKEQAETLIR